MTNRRDELVARLEEELHRPVPPYYPTLEQLARRRRLIVVSELQMMVGNEEAPEAEAPDAPDAYPIPGESITDTIADQSREGKHRRKGRSRA